MVVDIVEWVSEFFFIIKDIGKGSGLGLSQVFGFIIQSGGFVDVFIMFGVGIMVSLLFFVIEDVIYD